MKVHEKKYLEKFRGCVWRRSAECVEVLVDFVHLSGESKVAQFDLILIHEKHIFGFDVTMNKESIVLREKVRKEVNSSGCGCMR